MPPAPAVKRLFWIQVATIGVAIVEASLAIPVGLIGRSSAVLSFGLDSVIEVLSALTVLWIAALDLDDVGRERRELLGLRAVGALLVALAAYIAILSAHALIAHVEPTRGAFGIAVLAFSFLAMLALSRSKRSVNAELRLAALEADAKQSEYCAYLSIIGLAGVVPSVLFGWWWADSVAALMMIPLIVREGIEAMRGETCTHR